MTHLRPQAGTLSPSSHSEPKSVAALPLLGTHWEIQSSYGRGPALRSEQKGMWGFTT